MARFVVEMQFMDGTNSLLPSSGETLEVAIFDDVQSARRAANLDNLAMTLTNFNGDACDFPVRHLVGSRIFMLVEVA